MILGRAMNVRGGYDLRCGMRLKVSQAAFVAKDLLAVVGTIALLMLVVIPSGGSNQNSNKASLCMTNLRQLVLGWQLYASDNADRLVHNLHGADSLGGTGSSRFSPWASGWQTWGLESDNTNVAFLRDSRFAKLSPYLPENRKVHKCPADVYLSPRQRALGWKERARSYSMNLSLGPINYIANPGPSDPAYAKIFKLAELAVPGPSETSVFIEEHPDSINDVGLFPPTRSGWVDVPGNLHHGAGGFSFADGHVEVHPWIGSLLGMRVTYNNGGLPRARLMDPDLSWLSYRSQRVSDKSY